ncbi:hypothetical protein [Legionella brunensis]|uniref:Coiled-coil protein n=1 Tax=Legionella brunensis TaxID=29422 RepID=A0A0W0S062_9GAMM|nr:hypothetical protein [Legionella brunensis]KTC76887.1 coiled-coil protein [Legionella brunensis]
MVITLSPTSQDLISQLCIKNPSLLSTFQQLKSIDHKTLLDWFEVTRQIKGDEEETFRIASLHASLLKDLNESLNASKHKKSDKKSGGWSAKAKFALLAIAGTIYFGCEGFDGITAIMGIFSSVPTIAIFAAGTLFSILSIVVFYSFDLVEISKNLEVRSADAPKLLDVLLDEFKQIKALRLELSKTAGKTPQQLAEDLAIAELLLKRHQDLNESRIKLLQALDNPYLKVAKTATAGIAGIIFFSGGFFAGQTVALAIAGLFVSSVAATFWPVVLASVIVGLAAFSVYWFVERPGIENLISRWKGLDKEKMDALCESEVVERETNKLNTLIENLKQNASIETNKEQLESENKELRKNVVNLESQASSLQEKASHFETIASELREEVTRLSMQVEQMRESLQGVKEEQKEGMAIPEVETSKGSYNSGHTLFEKFNKSSPSENLAYRIDLPPSPVINC